MSIPLKVIDIALSSRTDPLEPTSLLHSLCPCNGYDRTIYVLIRRLTLQYRRRRRFMSSSPGAYFLADFCDELFRFAACSSVQMFKCSSVQVFTVVSRRYHRHQHQFSSCVPRFEIFWIYSASFSRLIWSLNSIVSRLTSSKITFKS